jgi:succinate dehydrogenase flavin-adding protein (antitoxin of CptAB toxin-antitoxin module)
MAEEVSINQMLDNAEAINKPQKVVNVAMIEDMSKVLKYRKDGVIPVKNGVNLDQAIQFIKTPSIDTPILLFDKLEAIKDRASGVTGNAAGVADETGKVGIYEGNQMAAADRFGLLNKSYSFGYKRFASLYEWGVKDNLTKAVAVDILGPNGVEVKNISKKDIYKRGDVFGCIVESSDAELSNSIRNQTVKLNFLNAQLASPTPMVNKEKAFEMSAKISGFNEEEVRELLDVKSYGNEELMSEADRDIEALLNGEKIEPNELANNAYKQKMVNYVRDHKEDISDKQFMIISAYIDMLADVIIRNEARAFETEQTDIMNAQTDAMNGMMAPPVPGQVTQPAAVPTGNVDSQGKI